MRNKYYFAFAVFALVFLTLNANGNQVSTDSINAIPESPKSAYSDKLQQNVYNPLASLTQEYDGVDTFVDDQIGQKPIYWLSTISGADSILVQTNVYSHNTIAVLTDSAVGATTCEYFFESLSTAQAYIGCGITEGYVFSCWFCVSTIARDWYLRIFTANGNTAYICFDSTAKTQFGTTISGQTQIETYLGNTWYFCQFLVYKDFFNIIYIKAKIGSTLSVEKTLTNLDTTITKFRFNSGDASGAGNCMYLDAFSLNRANSVPMGFKSQIKNQNTKQINSYPESYTLLDSAKLFSYYNSIIDKIPYASNNYRSYFITDNVMNTQYLDKNRVLRMIDSDTTANKYKIIQLYFDDLNETDAFKDNLNQTVQIRIDSLDSSNNLINKYYINLNFTKTYGLLTWNASYRESLAVPIWHTLPTNPIFRFSDYVPVGTVINTLSINIHCLLTYNLSQKIILIRTDVIFNDNKSQWFQYDKIINAGNSAFYYTQNRLVTRFIDYWNPNNGSDYLNNRWYTYNNLRGLRMLKTNTTDTYFNFLDAGIFNDELIYYYEPIPNIPKGSDSTPDKPQEPSHPSGWKYWTYDSYVVNVGNIVNIHYETLSVGGSGFDAIIDYDFEQMVVEKEDGRFYYPTDTFSAKSMGDWKVDTIFGPWKLNWLRDVVRALGNSLVVIGYGFGYAGTLIFNYVVMFFIVGIIGAFLWNFFVYWVIFAGLGVLYWLWIGVILLLWGIWQLLILLYTMLIVIYQWLINVALPLLLPIVIAVLAAIVASILWIFSMGTADWGTLYLNVSAMLTQIATYFLEILIQFIANLKYFLLLILWYCIGIGLLFAKYESAKARGYSGRAQKYYDSFQAFLLPFILVKKIFTTIKEMIDPAS